jgi:signal transduction histidine kinase
MVRLGPFIARAKLDIIRRWMALVDGEIVPDGMRTAELLDHLPIFLDELVAALADGESPSTSPTAAQHGVQRLRLGFDLGGVVHEYGALRKAILEAAAESEGAIASADVEVLTQAIVTGIADAVSEYVRQRDAELRRQATQHFAFVAHELRNPLMSAQLALALFREDKDPLTLRSIERNLNRIRELIDHSLALARFGTGIELTREPTDMKALLEEIHAEYVPSAKARGIRFDLVMDAAAVLDVDRRLIRSAVLNLVSNGIKFSDAGGAVALRMSATERLVRVEVQDTCGGLPAGYVDAAFDPFVQLHQGASGYGLGLAIVKQAVDAHGGRLQIQDVPGKGCIFALELSRTHD